MPRFPQGFFWGAATSAYQVEGNNVHSDWWAWEKEAGLKEPCGRACRHYEFYKSDFDLAKSLNHNAHRLSIEWSRVQPAESEFRAEEIGHYIDVIQSLRERNIEPIITLHHFTNPIWFADSGGWLNVKAGEYFLRYVETVVSALCSRVRFWVTINEPMVYVYQGYVLGVWPPQEKSVLKARKARDNLIIAHIQAYKLIHGIYKKRNLSSPCVSIAKNLQAFKPCRPTLKNKLASGLRDRLFNLEFINKLARHKSLDFIGVNYYTRSLVEVKSFSPRSLLLDTCAGNYSRLKKNSLGWDIYPQGLYSLALKLKKFNLPLFILENGICTDDDALRWDFIRGHLKSLSAAQAQGVRVLGYIYWSLLDNFEWDKGFGHRFGLISIDYNNYQRSIRDSAKRFAEVCKSRELPD